MVYLVVLPTNPEAVVDRALARFGLSRDTMLRLHGEGTFLPTDREVSAGELLDQWVELSLPAGRRQVEELAAACPCPPEKAELLALAGEQAHAGEVVERRVSVLDLLVRYPSIQLSFADFLGMLTPLAPRQYSISSSPLWRPDQATVSVAVLREPALSGQGTFEGSASTHLAAAVPGSRVAVTVRPGPSAFHPPADLSTPLVMVAAGTGIAPFRGFLQERALRAEQEGVQPAPALLFQGCSRPGVDELYADEMAELEARGIVEVHRAWSREPEQGPAGPIRYVQDRLWADRAEVERLFREGASVFVCGGGKRMAPGVRATCERIYAEALGVTGDDARTWMDAQEREHFRYVSDVFA